MSEEFGITFNKNKCVQCHGCEIACKTWRDVEAGISLRSIKYIWEGEYPDVKCNYYSVACMHCADPACVKACPENAITKHDADGVVLVDMEACTGCRLCSDACPFDVPQYGKDGKMRKCDLCFNVIDYKSQSPICVTTCPTQALRFDRISREDKQAAEENMKNIK